MNTRIYFEDKFIEFSNSVLQYAQNQSIKIYNEVENGQKLNIILDEFLEDSNLKSTVLLNQNFNDTLKLMKKYFHFIEAAGGFIEKKNEYLFIHRLGRWDLPKGKLEKGESPQAGAIRECEEETGVRKLTIIKELPSTFHIYQHKQGFALKQSYWFYMQTDFDKKLVAQTEENIDRVKWFTNQEIYSEIIGDTYYTIKDVIRNAISST